MEELVLKYGLYYVLGIIALYLSFRRFMYSIFDPFITIILTWASLWALSLRTNLCVYIILSIVSLWLGMYVASPTRIKRNFSSIKINDEYTFKLYTYLLFTIYIFISLYIFSRSGIPIFSSSPTEEKVAIWKGVGYLRRIKFISPVILINLIILLQISKHQVKYWLLIIMFCIIQILYGAKSGLLIFIFIFYYLMTQKNLFLHTNLSLKKIKKIIIVSLFISIPVLISIVQKEAEIEGQKWVYSLLFRLMEFGDVMLYYGDTDIQTFFRNNYHWSNFLGDELNGILGMLRITPYSQPLGYIMACEWRGYENDIILGPNCISIIKGHIYFGVIGGLVYSFICGYIFAKIRKYYFSISIKNLYTYSFFTFIFFTLPTFYRESGMFYSQIFDCFLLSIPLLFFSQCLSKMNIKHNSNLKYV